MSKKIVKDWATESGLRAVVIMTSMGHHCGYVAVPLGNPLHGVAYGEPTHVLQAPADDEPVGKRGAIALMCAAFDPSRMQSPDIVFNVHGGLTYSGGSPEYPVPHDGLWWFGYDCGHHGDGMSDEALEERRQRYPTQPFMWERDGEFRDLDYCIAECESLASQIAKATGLSC